MATHSDITNAEIDPDSPVITSLMTKLRDNPIAARKIGIKSGDDPITNDATLTNDPDMTIAVTGGQTWFVYGALYVTSDPAPDFKFSLVTPDTGNDTGIVFPRVVTNPTGGATVTNPDVHYNINTSIPILVTVTGSGEFVIKFQAQVDLNATPATGNIVVAWAQNTSNANTTTLKQESFLAGCNMDPT